MPKGHDGRERTRERKHTNTIPRPKTQESESRIHKKKRRKRKKCERKEKRRRSDRPHKNERTSETIPFIPPPTFYEIEPCHVVEPLNVTEDTLDSDWNESGNDTDIHTEDVVHEPVEVYDEYPDPEPQYSDLSDPDESSYDDSSSSEENEEYEYSNSSERSEYGEDYSESSSLSSEEELWDLHRDDQSGFISSIVNNSISNCEAILASSEHVCEQPFKNEKTKQIFMKIIKNHFPTRVIILGAPGVGKTTLVMELKRLLLGNPLHFPSGYIATNGIEISKLPSLEVWEFGGNDALLATHEFFLSENAQYIIVIDVSQLVSSDETVRLKSEGYFRYWANRIKSHSKSPHAPVLLVGTHYDFWNPLYFLMPSKATKRVLALASECGIQTTKEVFQISQPKKNFSASVKGLYDKILHQSNMIFLLQLRVFELAKNHHLDFSPVVFKMKVLEIRKQKPFIWWSEYLDIWKAFRWITSEKIHQITRLLVHSGEILTCGHPYTEQVSLVILDPEWFVRVLKSLNFVENMSRNSLETCWSSLGIGEKTWPQLEQLLQLFHLIIKLSNGEYLTISMIHATNESSLNNIERFYQRLPENSLCYGRSFKFSRLISGLADRLIIRILHYPGILIDKEICSKNDYFLYSNDFNVRVQVKSDENLLLVEVFSDLPSKASQLGFFVHYVFRSPESLLKSYPLHDARIISTQVFYSSKSEKIRGNSDVCLGKELDLIHQAIIQGKPLDQIPDIGLLCAPRLDCSTGRIERFLSGHSRFAWLATLTNQKVVLKELRYPSRIEQKEFLNEILMLCQIQSPFLINLIGICQISTSLLESCKESVACLDVEPMDNSGLLIALEFAPEGNLFDLHDKLRYSSMKMKLKIALDIARGLEIIHSCKLGIHRDVSSQNVFLFSLDELAVSDMNSIHAKLGDLGCVTIANPTYGEKFCNWQYMSPECFQPLAADYSSEVDVYAFGILLWEILTNLPPYHDQTNVQEVKLDILGGMRPKIPDTVPSAISQLIQSCWRKESNARPKFEQIVRILKSELYTYTYENFCARQQESYQRSISNYPQIDPAELFSGWQVLSKEEVLGKGCNGVVMKWEDGVCGPFAIKLLANYGVTTNQLSVVNRGEWALLEALPFHENIVKLLHRFRFRPPLDFLTNEHISHPSILDCVYHVNSFTNQRISNTCDFLVMEYLPGTLEDYLKVPQVNSVKRLLEICFDVAKGVKYLFDNRIVHRDLKLNNLLVSYAGVVVLCDFGSAIQLDNEQMVAILGPGGLPGGNWCHLAPEVRECKLEENQQKVISYKYQPSWELGILFLEIATLGEYPINSNEISPSDLHTFTQLTFPVEFCQLLNSCLSLVPTQRPNVDEICVLLQYLLYKTGQ